MVAVITKKQKQVRKLTKRPSLTGDLRLLEQKPLRSKVAEKRFFMYAVFAFFIAVLFLVAYAQARLVASQQDLGIIRTEIAELRSEKALLERSVEQSSALHVIDEKARDELGMIEAEKPAYLFVGGE